MMAVTPDWEKIHQSLPVSLTEQELQTEWERIARAWLTDLADTLDDNYTLHETENFIVLSCEPLRYLDLFTRFLESKLKAMLRTLPGIASDQGYGKHVVIIFNEVTAYDDYTDLFNKQNQEMTPSSGMYINEGYGHFVFSTQHMDTAEAIACHELTHACVSHLSLPMWLDEGIAVVMEDVLGVAAVNYMDHSYLVRHQRFWNETNSQDFWSGKSFTTFGPAQELSYSLAYMLVRSISADYAVFRDFVLHASYEDGGAQAAQLYLGVSLVDLLEALLHA